MTERLKITLKTTADEAPPQYLVRIHEMDGRRVAVKELGPYHSERTAERAERGLNINLDHANYYTEIVAVPS